MIIYSTVKEAFDHTFTTGVTAHVPAGARICKGIDGRLWVDAATWPAGSLERHDADYRGVPVTEDNANKWEA